MRKNIVVAAVTAGLVGCFPVSFDVTTSTSAIMSVKLGDVSGTCSGVTTIEDENSKATITKTKTGENCSITVAFEATAIDMGAVRAEVEAKIKEKGHNPKEVAVKLKAPTDLAFHDIHVAGVTIPSTAWELDASLQGTPIFSADGNDLQTLVAFGQSVALTDAQLKVANDAYKSKGPLTVTGTVVLSSVPLSYIEGLAKGTNASVDFSISADVTANGKMETL